MKPSEQEEFRGAGDSDVMQNDMRHLMNVLGVSTHARPQSPHVVFILEIIPSVVALKMENEALKLKAKHVAQSVNIIRSVMRLNREHKDLFGGAVYLVDHTHMWALVRNTEDLDALLQDSDDA